MHYVINLRAAHFADFVHTVCEMR